MTDSPKNRRWVPTLLIGDTIVLLLFTILGQLEHKISVTPLGVINATAPFWIAWVAVGFWLRAFQARSVERPLVAIRRVALPWVLALPIALQIRALLLGSSVQPMFALVTLGTVFVFLAGWRAGYATWFQRSTQV